MLCFLLASIAFAEPQFTDMKLGEPAPFDGKLLNNEAIIKLAVEDKFKVEQCDLQISYEKQKLETIHTFELEKVKIDLETDIKILEEKVLLRDQRINDIKSLSKPTKPILYVAGGFIVGAGSTIAILYAVYWF